MTAQPLAKQLTHGKTPSRNRQSVRRMELVERHGPEVTDASDDDSSGEQTLHHRICGESVACNHDASFTSAVSCWKTSDVKKKENRLVRTPNEKQAMLRHAKEKHSHCLPWNMPKVKETLDMKFLCWSPLQNMLAEGFSHVPLVPTTMPWCANPKDAII